MNVKEMRNKMEDMYRDIDTHKKIDNAIEKLSGVSHVFYSLDKEDRQTVYDAIEILRNKSEQLQTKARYARWDVNEAVDMYEKKSED